MGNRCNQLEYDNWSAYIRGCTQKGVWDGNDLEKRFRPSIHAVWKPASKLHCFRMKMKAFKMDSFFMLKEEIPPDKATIPNLAFSLVWWHSIMFSLSFPLHTRDKTLIKTERPIIWAKYFFIDYVPSRLSSHTFLQSDLSLNLTFRVFLWHTHWSCNWVHPLCCWLSISSLSFPMIIKF